MTARTERPGAAHPRPEAPGPDLRSFLPPQDDGGATAEGAVTVALRRAILSGVLRPGERLRQETLAGEFGVSRIPLRDALRRLSAEGLVRIDGRRGARVTTLDAAEARELYELRLILELHCLRQAIRHLTDEGAARLLAMATQLDPAIGHRAAGAVSARDFYTELYRWSGRPRIAATIIGLRHELNRYHALLGVPIDPSIHEAVREAIRTRDAEAAVRAMRRHLSTARVALLAVLRRRSVVVRPGRARPADRSPTPA